MTPVRYEKNGLPVFPKRDFKQREIFKFQMTIKPNVDPVIKWYWDKSNDPSTPVWEPFSDEDGAIIETCLTYIDSLEGGRFPMHLGKEGKKLPYWIYPG